jgi:hypothetical protein
LKFIDTPDAGRLGEIRSELTENVDEKIREELESKYVVDNIVNNVMADKALAWLEKQTEQKPAEWSEDDQSSYNEICNLIYDNYRAEDASRLITWLNDIKDRVLPQPKQEWSEEDESRIEECAREAEDNNCIILAKRIRQLKSLRPQNTRKPSDEHYELEEFAKIVRGNLTGISKTVQELLKLKYYNLTGKPMFGGFKD